MLPLKSPLLLTGLAACVLLPLGSCANSPWAKNLERSLAADPQLQSNPALVGTVTASPEAAPDAANLPAGFPGEIPRYPNAQFVSATSPDAASADSSTQTLWTTQDSAEQVRQFYQEQFQTGGWQIVPARANSAASSNSASPLQAERDGLRVTFNTASANTTSAPAGKTEFSIAYQFSDAATGAGATSGSGQATVPQPGDTNFVGPVPSARSSAAASPSPEAATATSGGALDFSDLKQAPADLQPYIADLGKLGALQGSGDATNLKPNQAITRREFARWLVSTNNLIYANQPARKIRLGDSSEQPAFQDVPKTDPDFGVIQGLADAGLVPSSLSGDATTVSFRPDAPLTREDLLLWKVPLDLRRSLPNASLDAVQQTWGFQDAARIEPKALRAVLADYQNGDLSNIRRAFGYTTLFQPKKPVTRAEAAASLWYFGTQGDGLSAKDAAQTSQATNSSRPVPVGP